MPPLLLSVYAIDRFEAFRIQCAASKIPFSRSCDVNLHDAWSNSRIYWRPGKLNYADYWTKHHAALHHKNVRKEFLKPHIVLEMLRIEQSRIHEAAGAA